MSATITKTDQELPLDKKERLALCAEYPHLLPQLLQNEIEAKNMDWYRAFCLRAEWSTLLAGSIPVMYRDDEPVRVWQAPAVGWALAWLLINPPEKRPVECYTAFHYLDRMFRSGEGNGSQAFSKAQSMIPGMTPQAWKMCRKLGQQVHSLMESQRSTEENIKTVRAARVVIIERQDAIGQSRQVLVTSAYPDIVGQLTKIHTAIYDEIKRQKPKAGKAARPGASSSVVIKASVEAHHPQPGRKC